ncbi:MAG: sodium/proton-translocating pyrophosphatase, partial [Parcubacteria group bacterium]|nr:sodium/proton-translocating pyrophosphatase [Parcubacteria group bacterium]
MDILQIALFASIASIAYGGFLAWGILQKSAGDKTMQAIAKAIQEGATAYLARQSKAVALVGISIAFILWFFLGRAVAVGFLIGAVASGLAGYIGMMV